MREAPRGLCRYQLLVELKAKSSLPRAAALPPHMQASARNWARNEIQSRSGVPALANCQRNPGRGIMKFGYVCIPCCAFQSSRRPPQTAQHQNTHTHPTAGPGGGVGCQGQSSGVPTGAKALSFAGA